MAVTRQQAKTGTPVANVLRRMIISEETLYCWRKHYGGLGGANHVGWIGLKEDSELEKLLADLSLDEYILQSCSPDSSGFEPSNGSTTQRTSIAYSWPRCQLPYQMRLAGERLIASD